MTSLGLLIKKASKGENYQWIDIFYTNEGYYSSHGRGKLIDGEFVKNDDYQTTEITISKTKNVGKKNETTQSQQALAEATKKWNDKKHAGYHNIGESESNIFHPMLCREFGEIYKPDYNVCYQPKIDGIRCIIHIINRTLKCISRNNHNFDMSLDSYFNEVFKNIVVQDKEVYLDGEIVSKSGHLEDAKTITSGKLVNGEYVMFDMYDPVQPELPYNFRCRQLNDIMTICKDKNNKVGNPNMLSVEVISSTYDRFDKADKYLDIVIKNNMEGLIIRDPTSVYEQNKRSKFVLKYKKTITQEFAILEVLEGEGNKSGLAASMRFRFNESNEFSAGLKCNNEKCKEIWINRNSYVGKLATVEYLDKTKYGVPKFAKFISVRDYE